jgi:PadR family transcriptional regulator
LYRRDNARAKQASLRAAIRFRRGPPAVTAIDTPALFCHAPVESPQEEEMARDRFEIMQGTLDLMVLKTLESMGAQHGYGIARRIEQTSEDLLQLNQGTIYASLVRLQQKGWISAAWGTSENNRQAKFYSITRAGRKQLQSEAENWKRIAGVMGRILQLGEKG